MFEISLKECYCLLKHSNSFMFIQKNNLSMIFMHLQLLRIICAAYVNWNILEYDDTNLQKISVIFIYFKVRYLGYQELVEEKKLYCHGLDLFPPEHETLPVIANRIAVHLPLFCYTWWHYLVESHDKKYLQREEEHSIEHIALPYSANMLLASGTYFVFRS